jgi:hypothetical protein
MDGPPGSKGRTETTSNFGATAGFNCCANTIEALIKKKAADPARTHRDAMPKPLLYQIIISTLPHPNTQGRALIANRSVEEGFKAMAAAGMAEFAEGFGFDLTNTLAGDGEVLAYFFQRMFAAVL